jgi:enoyl-CoA hydratase/carnithine racemase
MANVLLVARRDHVVTVTLNRPEVLNALDVELMTALRRLWSELGADTDVRCVVLTGAGRGFCAGADVSMLAADRPDAAPTARDELAFLPGRRVAVPIVVAVNGVCAGGGLHFVADADIVLAAERASFLDPHVSVGQVSALEPLSLLARARHDVVARMALLGSGERLGAHDAQRAGLVSEVVPDAELPARAGQLATTIAGNSPEAVRQTRRALRVFEERLLERPLEEGWAAIRRHWSHPDAAEGPAAFLAERDPQWTEPAT